MKAVLLCSGGFDSVVLANYVRDWNNDLEIETLFFDYGQKSVKMERKCAIKVSEKIGAHFNEIKLPKFTWTKSAFYNEGYNTFEGEYLEMRNMVFLSYALSLCESISATKLYWAALRCHGYYDVSVKFLAKIGSIARDKGVDLCTPFCDYDKENLAGLAYYFNITERDFHTCDNPVEGKPCGECPDCRILKGIMNSAKVNTPLKAWLKSQNPRDKKFQELFMQNPIREMRVLVNNDCQLHCKHCYYGFDKMTAPRLSLEEFKSVFEQSRDLGINEYHFAGKEPFYDEFIFDVAKVLKRVHPKANLTAVSNGINIPKYIDSIKELGFEYVIVSVDEILDTSYVRTSQNVADKAIRALNSAGVGVHVILSVHKRNFSRVDEILEFLFNTYQIQKVCVQVITNVGSAKDIDLITNEEVAIAYKKAKAFSKRTNKWVVFSTPVTYTYNLYFSKGLKRSEIFKDLCGICDTSVMQIGEYFQFCPEFYCRKYEDQITLTPDGFLHGCAMECSIPEYSGKVSPGNVRNVPLCGLIQQGKKSALTINKQEVKGKEIYFLSCTSQNFI